jgi:RNA polymerase sigma-70 factor (ECF subfamily)
MNGNPKANTRRTSNRTLEMAMDGDPAAIDELFAPCIPRLRRVTARLLPNAFDSEDALQDGLLSAYRHLSQFQGRAQFATWLHSIVVNAARTKLRRRLSGPSVCSLDQPLTEQKDFHIADTIIDPRPSVEQEYEQTERIAILSEIIDTLPPRWRLVVRLYDVEGLSMREVARRLGMTVSAAKTRHYRANRFLDRLLTHARARRRESPRANSAGHLRSTYSRAQRRDGAVLGAVGDRSAQVSPSDLERAAIL